jgi:uncharacterized protein (DUF1501 family)
VSESFSRRDMLKWMSAGAGAATIGAAAYMYDGNRSPASSTASSTSGAPGTTTPPDSGPSNVNVETDMARRTLVVVELEGGNDGQSMVVPYGLGSYYDARPNSAIAENEVLRLDDRFGLHPQLARLHQRGVSIVQGVGSKNPSGSHFEMRARWAEGSPDALGQHTTGFLGRLSDALGDDDAVATAVSIGDGSHPSMLSERGRTVTITNADAASYLTGATDDDILRLRFQTAYRALADLSFDSATVTARHEIMRRTVGFAEAVGVLENDAREGYRDDQLGQGLRLAAQLLGRDVGIRVVHVVAGMDFDTHDDHAGRYSELMGSFDESMDAFMNDITQRGLGGQVLVATVSEFGRTLRDNGSSGLDHGVSSNMLMLGPVNSGLHGEQPAMREVDDGGLATTVGFDDYYATLADRWLGLDAADIVGAGASPLDGIIVGG